MYPINLILDNKPCVVLGGGHVALRKVKGLLDAKAKVTVISPEIVAELAKLVEEKRIIWQKKCYEQGDLDDFTLAICAIGNEKINAEVQREAKQKKVILNVVDRLEFCDLSDDVMELVKNKKYDEAEASIRDAISSFRA